MIVAANRAYPPESLPSHELITIRFVGRVRYAVFALR